MWSILYIYLNYYNVNIIVFPIEKKMYAPNTYSIFLCDKLMGDLLKLEFILT